MKVTPNEAASFAVTLSAPAPAGGVTVTLKSSDDSKVIVTPASVIIPQGTTTPTTQPQVTGAGIGSATITAIATGYTSGTGTVTVTAPTMVFTGSPPVIAIGGVENLTLSLTGGQAPVGGLTVNLSSSDTSKATVPGTVSFAAGATSVTVPVTGVTPGSVTLTASAPNIASATASVTVTGTINSPANTTVKLGQSASFEVTLSAPAPAGGVIVTLKSSDTSKVIVTPASVVIPQGATTSATQPQVTGAGIGSATITAAATGYTSGTGAVTVTPPTMVFTGSPLVIALGGIGNLTLSLTGGQAPVGGLTVNLNSSDPNKARVSVTVSFAAGATSVTVPVAAVAPGTTTITASAPGLASATTSVNVTPPPTVTASYGANSLQLINVGLVNTSGVTAVNLRIISVTNVTAMAPNVIALRPNVIIPMPYGTLAGGQGVTRSFTFEATAGSIEVPFSFTITYAADNMPPQTAVIDVPFPRSMNFSGSPLAINAGVAGKLTLNLLGNQAPASGLIVSLKSSDPSRASVPATVSFAPGAASVTVPVAGLAPGPVTITATATVVNFPAIATAIVNVTGTINLPANTPVKLGQSASFAVTLSAPAPAGGVTVTLKSSDDGSKVIVTPASVVIPQGATTPTTQPQVTGAGIGSITITAAATGYTSGTGTVTVTAPTMVFTGPPLVIAIGGVGNLTLSLTGGQAPAGGLTVNLSASDTSKVKVSVMVSFAAGATSVTLPVAAVAPGTTTITASAPNIASATTSVTVMQSPTVTAAFASRSLERVDVVFTNTSRVTAVNVRITGVTNVEALAPNVIVPRAIFQTAGTLEGGQANIAGVVFEATAGSLSVPFRFTITYQADNMPVRTAVIDVPFLQSMSFAGSPLAISAGASGNLTLNLTGTQAPAGGLTVNLNSSDTSKATVPRTVSFVAGATSVVVPVTGLMPGSATITASAPGIASATAGVTVSPPPTVSVVYAANFLETINVIVTNTSGVTAVNLRIVSVTNVTAAPPNLIALRPNNFFPMSCGTLAGGQAVVRGFLFQATAGSISVPFRFMVTCQADNMPPQTAVIDVPFPRAMSFSGSPLAIVAGAPGKLTLNLLGNQAPAAGLIVSLSSSDPSRATVPATVTFPPAATSVTVPVTGLAPGSVTITATATVVNFPAIATAVVNVGGGR